MVSRDLQLEHRLARSDCGQRWRTPKNTMLVVNLIDYGIRHPHSFSDAHLSDDYHDTGFVEIWLADHTQVEAFRAVRLVGLYPREHWGLHNQPSLSGKPYG